MALLYEAESYRILGACFEVYKEKGCGFLEAVYHECLKIEFSLQQIPFLSKPILQLSYKEQVLEQTYEPDFVCFGEIILEIKALPELNNVCRAQAHNCLRCSRMRLALLANFGHFPKLEHERIIL